MKVLHVTECHAGGVSRAIRARLEASSEHEHHLLWAGEEDPEVDGRWASATRLPPGLARRVRAVGSAVSALAPDLVHAHSSWGGVYTRMRRLNAPVVYEPHCFKHDDQGTASLLRKFYRVAERKLSFRTAGYGVLSPHESRLAKALNASVPRVAIPNVPSIKRSMARPAANATPTIAMIGRVTDQKDPEFFIQVIKEVRHRTQNVNAVWIGDGAPKAVRSLLNENIDVTGWLSATELERQLSLTQVYVHSARYEGFPISVLDAAEARVPIVARNIPAFEGTPLLVASTPEEIAESVLAALSNPGYADHLTQRGTSLLESMNTSALRQGLIELYGAGNGESSC